MNAPHLDLMKVGLQTWPSFCNFIIFTIKPSLVIYVWRAFLNSKSYKVIKMYNLNWTCLKTLVRIIALAPNFWDLKSIGSGAWTERIGFAYEHLDHRPPYSPSKTKVAGEVARSRAAMPHQATNPATFLVYKSREKPSMLRNCTWNSWFPRNSSEADHGWVAADHF